jgi:hypothetical protein
VFNKVFSEVYMSDMSWIWKPFTVWNFSRRLCICSSSQDK